MVVAHEVVVLDELGDREAEVALAERNELVRTLGVEGEHEAFRENIQSSSDFGRGA